MAGRSLLFRKARTQRNPHTALYAVSFAPHVESRTSITLTPTQHTLILLDNSPAPIAKRHHTHTTEQSVLSENAQVDKGENARMASFVGALAIADLVKSTLGPKGMGK